MHPTSAAQWQRPRPSQRQRQRGELPRQEGAAPSTLRATDRPEAAVLRRNCSDLKRRTAAASAGHVRIAELEARAMSAFDVVDLGSIEILIAQRIDIEPHSIRLEALVELGGGFFEVQVVLETGAAAAHHAEA